MRRAPRTVNLSPARLKARGSRVASSAADPHPPGAAPAVTHRSAYPPIAEKGLNAARRYASIAPAAPHALHMPSHIFTRRGYWQDSIEANPASARSVGYSFHCVHPVRYLAYASLQMVLDRGGKGVCDLMSELH